MPRTPGKTFRLVGGTAEQRAVVRLALHDINRIAGGRGPFRARKNGPACRRIEISEARFEPPDHDASGYHQSSPRLQLIALHAGLPNSHIYGVFLHEFGHFLGLGHRSEGLMAPTYEQRAWGRLTRHLRRRLSTELGQLLLSQSISQIL